jgi:hypothetical protein
MLGLRSHASQSSPARIAHRHAEQAQQRLDAIDVTDLLRNEPILFARIAPGILLVAARHLNDARHAWLPPAMRH